MQCKKCGANAPADSAFCPKCGTALADAPAAMAAAAAAGNDAPSGTQRVVSAARGRGGSPAEDELWAGAYSAKAMAGTFAAVGVLTLLAAVACIFFPPGWILFLIAAIVAWGGLGLLYWYRRVTVRYRLTSYRFFHESGLLSRVANRIEVIDIDDVTVRQGPIERMFDVGTIRVTSSDKTNPDLDLPGIDHAKQVADLIDGARRAERHRRGLHIESI